MNCLSALLAQTTPATSTAMSRTYYEVMRLRQLDEWWHWLLLVLVCLIVLVAVSTMYFMDSRQLARGKRWLLLFLRVTAFLGLLVFFLDLQKRTEQKLVKNSRFAVLVDTSQSMGIADPSPDAETAPRRIDQISETFRSSDMLKSLHEKHDVTVYRFDETNLPIEVATFSQGEQATAEAGQTEPTSEQALTEVRSFWKIAIGLFVFSLLAFVLHLVLGNVVRTAEGESWALLVSIFALIVGVVLVAVSNLRQPDYGPLIAFGLREPATTSAPDDSSDENATKSPSDVDELQPELKPSEVDWAKQLEPAGGSTRLGDAIRWLIDRERGNPLAGVAVVTDGNSNRGIEPLAAAQLAGDVGIPIYPVGIGSELPPTNVRVVDLEAPARVYPGDEFKLTGFLQAYGLEGQEVELQLVSRPDRESEDQVSETTEAVTQVQLEPDGTVTPIPLQVTPEEVGKRIYTLKVTTKIDRDTSDNQVSANVQIIDQKSRVLLVAGGPTREYRFLRNMLHRDKDVSVDVLLQTAVDGVAQESDDLLFDLPFEPAELYNYDTIVAFDPDWKQFDTTQIELIEKWIAEKAGGLVAIAGPVHTGAWAEDRRTEPQIEVVKQLYPVTFSSSRIELGRYGSEVAWPLEITTDGRSASFFSLTDDGMGLDTWQDFPGVYGYYPIRDVKPAAQVLARYSDPQVALDGDLPPLIVSQLYGSGRVVFLGTGEFWRLRAIDDGYFERFYTKLIRHVAEGRLMRDSNRGLLLVDKERALRGDAISIRASIVNQQFEPLRDPSVKLTLNAPDKSTQQLELQRADGGRDGMYAGRFMATQAGNYKLQLALPGDGEPVILEREVRVRLPNLEVERPQRNDAVLRRVAGESNGKYFVGLAAAASGEGSLASTAISKRRETFLPGTPDRDFQRRLMTWLMVLICGALFLEWIIRRLSKLA